MNPALWGTLTALGWGMGDFCARFSGRAIGEVNALFGMLAVGSVLLTLWVWLSGAPLVWETSGLWLLGVTGLGTMVATLVLYRALIQGPLTVVAPIVGSYPAVVVAIAVMMGSRPNAVQWAAIAVVMAGVVVVAVFARQQADDPERETVGISTTITLSLVSSLVFALTVSAGQAAVPIYGELQTTWVARLISLAAVLPLFLLPGKGIFLPLRWWPLLTAQGVLDTGAYLALFAGSHGANPEIAAVTSSGFGAVTVLLARVFLSESVGPAQWAGMVMIFAGVAVLSG